MGFRLSLSAPSLVLAFALGFALALAPTASPAQGDAAATPAALKKQCSQTADQAHKASRDLRALARKKGIEPAQHRHLLESASKLERDEAELKALAKAPTADPQEIQFKIQTATSDLQNAESVRSQVKMALEGR